MKRPPPITKFWYIQDCGTYRNEILVFIGYSPNEIISALEEGKIKDSALRAIKEMLEGYEPAMLKHSTGSMCFKDGFSLFRMPKFEDDWDDLETIMHECFHATMFILGRNKAFINHTADTIEDEGMAYFHEYLFRSIRRKLTDEYWRKSRKAIPTRAKKPKKSSKK